MKFKEVTTKQFTPFTVTITFETEEESRLMWHVFNRYNLKGAIFSQPYGCSQEAFEMNMDNEFRDLDLRDFISSHVNIFR